MANRSIDKENKAVRASISFPQEDYESLEKIAEYKKVSIAWIVREAVDSYLHFQKKEGVANESK